MNRMVLIGGILLSALSLAACGGGDPDQPQPADPAGTDAPGADRGGETVDDDAAAGDQLAGDLTVFAAASLNIVFTDLAEVFTEQHPGARVTFSFAGSADLVAQLDAGAPADVLATADEATMAGAIEAGTIDAEPVIFAENVLTLITPADNPGGVTGLDESLLGTDLVICAPQVPCGAATIALADAMDVTLHPASEENNVTDVLGKVVSGQADAGLVYATEAHSAGEDVQVIEVPGAQDVVNRYPIAVTAGTDQPELAQAWVEFVTGPLAQEAFTAAGFRSP